MKIRRSVDLSSSSFRDRLERALHALLNLRAGASAFSVLALAGLGLLATAQPAAAVPSFARQTGQPCAACHTAFPELTPFGRRFKLEGYTLEGGDGNYPVPIAAVVQSSLTEYLHKLDAPAGAYTPPSPNGGFKNNDNIDPGQQMSLFYAGKIYGNLGAFVQTTFTNAYVRNYALDLADIRYADKAKIGFFDFTYGLTVNNAPSVQDVWNTTPQWSFPFIKSVFSLSPATATMLDSFGSSQTVGAGAYIFAHDLVYAEISLYDSLSPRAQTTLGASPPALANTISGKAPYWRLAIEPTWGEHSLMVGTFGMHADILPNRVFGAGTDKITDIGVDSQYQWIGDVHAITARASYIYEHQQLDATNLLGNSANAKNHLRSFKASASYIYDHTVSLTGGYFLLTGSPDALAYATNANFSPNSQGWIADIAYLPFSKGAPGPWPWVNTRIGASYTWYTKFDGGKADIDPVNCPLCRKAKDNNTLLIYAFTAF
jgi:hypothetical protein